MGSESLKQAKRIVGKRGIAWKRPMDADTALKRAKGNHSEMPAFWADDGSGLYGQIYNIPVLKAKPAEALKQGDVQLIV